MRIGVSFWVSSQHHFEKRAVFVGRGVRAVGTNELPTAAEKSAFGVCGVVGGKMVIELLAGKMRLDRGGIAAVGCSSMGAGSIGGKNYCGNLLW